MVYRHEAGILLERVELIRTDFILAPWTSSSASGGLCSTKATSCRLGFQHLAFIIFKDVYQITLHSIIQKDILLRASYIISRVKSLGHSSVTKVFSSCLHHTKTASTNMHYLPLLFIMSPFTLTASHNVNVKWQTTHQICNSLKELECCTSIDDPHITDNAEFSNLPVDKYRVQIYGWKKGGCSTEETAVTSEAPQPTFTMKGVTAVAWDALKKDADAAVEEIEEEEEEEEEGILRVQEL